jgi:hypothetical protein
MEGIKMYEYNAAFNLVMKIKRTYLNRFGEIKTYNLEQWIEELNIEEYNRFAESVSFNFREDKPWVLIKYSMITVDRSMWENKDSVYRECRSVVINLKDEELVLVPFRKFFNLNEVAENEMNVIQKEIEKAKSVEFSNKLDGSMQQARYYQGEFVMSGSSALEVEKSFRLEEGYQFLTQKHKNLLTYYPELTFIFEYISMRDQHVVRYTEDDQGLYLIGARNVYTGAILSYKQLRIIGEINDVAVVDLETGSLEEMLEKAKKYRSDEKEGWVINIDGHLVKLKCDDYTQIHRVLSKISSINLIIQSIAEGTYDDLVSKVPKAYKERVQRVAEQIYKYIQDTEHEISEWYRKAPKKDRKGFMIWVDHSVPKELVGYVKCKYVAREYNLLKGGNEKSPRYIRARQMGIGSDFKPLFDEE